MENNGITILDTLVSGFKNMVLGLPELGFEQLANGVIALKNGRLPTDIIQKDSDSELDLGFADKSHRTIEEIVGLIVAK